MKNPFSAAARRLGRKRADSSNHFSGDPYETRSESSSRESQTLGFGSWRQKRVVERAEPRGSSAFRDPEFSKEDQIGREDWGDVEDTREPVAARTFSGRTVLLLLIILALVVPLAPTVHRYFAQQAEINSLQQDISHLKDEQQDLKDQNDRWNDDDYVRQQARERLFYVNPGETPYVVTGKDKQSDQADDSSAEATTSTPPSWGENLWASLSESSK
ncbi:FtsB family cell division protein [Rothia uropygioeca]|uniref:FtsB family cell division protein n=1 Tax=Kocuria sp. 257 TaxID=2021970 RepID=UPI0010135500|nr:septum formation initiator family protein [Kocuria sp. 257]